jgi:hypothetical protein
LHRGTVDGKDEIDSKIEEVDDEEKLTLEKVDRVRELEKQYQK